MNASHRQDASQGQGEVRKQIKHGEACLTSYLSTTLRDG